MAKPSDVSETGSGASVQKQLGKFLPVMLGVCAVYR